MTDYYICESCQRSCATLVFVDDRDFVHDKPRNANEVKTLSDFT